MRPEVRLSPDGQRIAVRFPESDHWTLHGYCYHCGSGSSDDYVSDWTPLIPESSEDGAA